MTHATPRQTAIQNILNFAIANPDDLQDLCGMTDEEIESTCGYIKHAVNTLEEVKAVLQTLVEKFQAQARVGDRYYTASTYDYETIQAVLAKLEGRE